MSSEIDRDDINPYHHHLNSIFQFLRSTAKFIHTAYFIILKKEESTCIYALIVILEDHSNECVMIKILTVQSPDIIVKSAKEVVCIYSLMSDI